MSEYNGLLKPKFDLESLAIPKEAPPEKTSKHKNAPANSSKPNAGTGKKMKLEDFTKEVLETKPMNSPQPDKWLSKGGSISINENGTWTYTNKEGQSVSYPNGYPDFSQYIHPKVKPVTIIVSKPSDLKADYRAANEAAHLSKDSDPPVLDMSKPPEGYTWHHHQDGKTMILVDDDIHRDFRHIGGNSTVNGKNGQIMKKQ